MGLLLLLFNVILFAVCVYGLQKAPRDEFGYSILRHLAMAEAAWSSFSFVGGLFLGFDIVERTSGKISDWLKAEPELVTAMLFDFGYGVFHFVLVAFIATELIRRRRLLNSSSFSSASLQIPS